MVAALIDGALTTVVASLILWPLGFDFGEYYAGEAPLLALRAVDVQFVLVSAVVGALYFPSLMLAWDGRTLGKRALGIRVVRADGRPLDAGTVLLRQVVLQYLFLALVPLIGLINYLMPLADDYNRAGHDRVARTLVLRG